MTLDAHLGAQLHIFGSPVRGYHWLFQLEFHICLANVLQRKQDPILFHIWEIHFHIQVCIVNDIRCVVLIISLRDFIIVLDEFKLFAKIAIVINKVCPMVRVGIIPGVFILTADFHSLLHVLIKLLKFIPYLCSRLLNFSDPLNGLMLNNFSCLG